MPDLVVSDQAAVPKSAVVVLGHKVMKLRYAGTCRRCGVAVDAGQRGAYFKADKQIECMECFDSAPAGAEVHEEVPGPGAVKPVTQPEVVETVALSFVEGDAGASARVEYERRMARREKRVKERFPRAGGLLLKVFEEGQPTKAWKVGAGGEEQLGTMLDGMAGRLLRVLHDRRIPRTRANIDHIVVCPNGVMVVDAKQYKGRVALKSEGGLFSPLVRKLTVAGRDRTKLADGVAKQVGLVTEALEDVPVPVQGMLCFLGAEWPMFGGAFVIRDIGVMWPRRLRRLLSAPGPLTATELDQIQIRLSEAFPRA